jgi:hypothetical protein
LEAEAIVRRFDDVRHQQGYVNTLLEEAQRDKSISKLETALMRAQAISLGGEEVRNAQDLLRILTQESVRLKVMSKLADAVRLRSAQALQRALSLADDKGITGTPVDLTREFYKLTLEYAKIEKQGDSAKMSECREKLNSVASSAIGALVVKKPLSRKNSRASMDENIDSDEDDDDLIDDGSTVRFIT